MPTHPNRPETRAETRPERLSMAAPAEYRVRVQGVLERSWVAQFVSMRVAYRHVGMANALTVLTGDVLDQSALLGLLTTLYGLGLPLVSVQWRPKQGTRAPP